MPSRSDPPVLVRGPSMRSLRECPSCRALLTPEQRSAAGRACPYCGRPTDDLLDDDDPFAPTDAAVVEDAATPLDAPPDFWGKLRMAARLFLGQLPLYAALVLTVWLPGNAIVELVDVTNANPNPENALAIVFLRV